MLGVQRIEARTPNHLSIGAIASRFLWMAFVVTVPPLCLMVDIKLFGSAIPEASFTEITQALFLVVSAITFLLVAKYVKEDRMFGVLAAAFFVCLLIREMDMYLDAVFHGFWKYLATPLAIASVGWAAIHTNQVLSSLSYFLRTQAGMVMMVGLVVLLFYSRIFGMTDLWKEVMGEDYIRTVKNAVEETCELLGYSLIVAASLRYFFHRKKLTNRAE